MIELKKPSKYGAAKQPICEKKFEESHF